MKDQKHQIVMAADEEMGAAGWDRGSSESLAKDQLAGAPNRGRTAKGCRSVSRFLRVGSWPLGVVMRIEEGEAPMKTSPTIRSVFDRPALGFAVRTRLVWAPPICLLGLLVLTGAGMAPIEPTPTESVSGTINEVIRILDMDALKQSGRSEERRREIERVLRHRISYERMAKRALGPTWVRLTDMERQEFVDLFVQLLRDTFAYRINEYSGERVRYVSERREGRAAEVSTRLIGQKVDTPMAFRLENLSGDWLVYDIVIDGASIIHNYRAQFMSILRDHSFAELIRKMHHKTLLVKEFEKTIRP